MGKSVLDRLAAELSHGSVSSDEIVSDWIEACCDVSIRRISTTGELYRACSWWQRQQGATLLLTEMQFARSLAAMSIPRAAMPGRARGWRGLVVLQDCVPPSDWTDDGMKAIEPAKRPGPDQILARVSEWIRDAGCTLDETGDTWTRSDELYTAYSEMTGHNPGRPVFGAALALHPGLHSDRIEIIEHGKRRYLNVWRGIELPAELRAKLRLDRRQRPAPVAEPQPAHAPVPDPTPAQAPAAPVKPWMVPAVPDAEHNAWRAEQLRLHEQRRQRDYAAAVAAAQQREHPDDI